MGKSVHKSKKRKRSSSRSRGDRLTSLENKMSRLIDILSQREVKAPNVLPQSPVTSFCSGNHDIQGSRIDSEFIDHIGLDSDNKSMAPLARQAEPADPNSGVYDIAGSVFEKYKRHDGTTFFFLSDFSKLPSFLFSRIR